MAEATAPPDWRSILDFERSWTEERGTAGAGAAGSGGSKERAIRARFQISSARYHQLLDRALDLPDALARDPMLVQRLRRLREVRRDKRFARRLGSDWTGG